MQYILTCGGAAAVVDTLGGELISYKTPDGTERLWCGDAAYWAGHAPVLFPAIGALQAAGVTMGGKPYGLTRHGFARKMEFEAASITETAATFVLKANEATLAIYPYDFVLTITHTITETAFTTAYQVSNAGVGEMYFCIGGHTGFACPLNVGEAFGEYQLVFDTPVENLQPLYPDANGMIRRENRLPLVWDGTTLPLCYRDFDENDTYVFDGLAARHLALLHQTTGEGIRFAFHGFANLAIWSPPGKNAPFVCLEPWQGMPAVVGEGDALEEKSGVICLAAGERYTAGYTATVLFAK